MNGTITLPGPETLILFGVHVKVLSAIFGMGGVLLGHFMAPRPAEPVPLRRQVSVLVAGQLIALAITILTGQQPLLVLAWCIGVGLSGISLYQGWGARAKSAGQSIGDAALSELNERLAGRKDKP